jgi:D-alanyl-lipoteichoic acid acyltransferase DltB (MBOAT superfamily)
MLFNSNIFLAFFAAFLLLYYLARNHLRLRNVLIVIASYLFYGWWDYRFLSLLIISSLLDYGVGLALAGEPHLGRRKLWLALSVTGNLTLLGFFKYYDFFVESMAALLAALNVPIQPRTLGVILPIGISFYTFQTMSYTLDVYRGQMPATRDLVNFLAFVAFFPQLVAGPIERARHLLPQFERTLAITQAGLAEGLWLILWGMFKKVVIADNLAPMVEMVYQAAHPSGLMVALGTLAFGLQIYGDFSGYSDIARGTAQVLGFDIMINFRLPYAATNLRAFWQRWHISLSTWLRDYLYISLGGNRLGARRTYLNLLLTMLLGGLWHGAAWNFVLWGLWHGSGLMAHRWWSETRRNSWRAPPIIGWAGTMLFVFYGWLLFRAGSLDQVMALTRALGDFSVPQWWSSYALNLLVFALPLALVQYWQHKKNDLLAPLAWPAPAQMTVQGLLLLAILLFWQKDSVPFIYFQF